MTEHRITTPHGTVAVVDYGGDGPDVLLLPGGASTLADWGMVRPHLHGRRVVAADLRWHGLSSDEGDVSLEANADDVEAIIDALGLDNPVVAGWSLGGMVAAVYGTRHPGCPGVINVDGHGPPTPDPSEGNTTERLQAFRNAVETFQGEQVQQATSGDDAWRDTVASQARADMAARGRGPLLADGWEARSFVRGQDGAWNIRPNPRYDALLQPVLWSVRMFDIYRAVECPLVIYNCTRDDPGPIPIANEVNRAYRRGLARDLKALAAERPNVRVRTLEATHDVIFEMPEEVASDILSLAP